MAVIGKIRERSTLLVVIVGLAMAAFVLGDLFKNIGVSSDEYTMGEVHGEPISSEKMNEYNERVEAMMDQYMQQGMPVSGAMRKQIEDAQWRRLIMDLIYGREVELLGLTVTKEELTDLVHGDSVYVSPSIKSIPIFIDSMTGKFSSQLVTTFIRNLEERGDPGMKKQWESLILDIRTERLYAKYTSLITKAVYTTTFEAEQNQKNLSESRKIKFVVKKYMDIPDAEIEVNDDQIYKYYQKHKNEKQYEQPGSKLIELVRIEMELGEDDLEKTRSILEGKKARFAKADNDSLYVVTNSSNKVYNPNYFIKKGELPAEIDLEVFAGDTGIVVGPYLEGNSYRIAKILGYDKQPERSVRHILIPFEGAMMAAPEITRSKAQAKVKADSILRIITADTSKFTPLAASESSDQGSSMNGGRYDWFPEGQMVAAFNDFCFKNPVGSKGVVETEYGYHVMEVTGAREDVARAVTVEAEVKALQNTIKKHREKAIEFISATRNKKTSFTDLSGEFQYPVQEMEIRDEDFSIPGLDNSYEIIGWLKTAMKDEISNPVVNDNTIIIARMVKIKPKGTPDFEDVKEMMRVPTVRDLKFEAYRDKMAANSMDEVASRVKEPIQDATLRFSDYTIPGGGGNEPEVVGAIFANFPQGSIIGPVKGKVGIYTILLESVTPGSPSQDIEAMKKSMTSTARSGVEAAVFNALEKMANVIDKRER